MDMMGDGATNGDNGNDQQQQQQQQGPQSNDDDRKLFAGGLAQEATEKDITDYFKQFGGVASVTLKMDQMTGRSRGFAFVVFSDVDTLNTVLQKDHVIKGKKVAVKKAASKQGKIYVGKFKDAITEDQIRDHFAQFGNVVEIQRPVDRSKNSEPKNFCFITYDKEEPANQLLKKGTVNVAGQEVEIKKVTVKADGGMMRGGMRGGRGGGGGGGWMGGYDAGWGYGGWGGYEGPPGPWAGYGGGYGGGWGGGWGGDGYGGGGKMAGGAGTGGGFRGGRGGRGGRSAPY